MKPERFHNTDIQRFLDVAETEAWLVDRWELDFLLDAFPQGCLVVRGDSGRGLGFVTALRHSDSGWIGNLIVEQHARSRGIGKTLFQAALQALQDDGVRTVWLTASESGMPLYKKFGFRRVDTIHRWFGTGRRSPAIKEEGVPADGAAALDRTLDVRGWGDCRDSLLNIVRERGRLVTDTSGFLVVQPCSSGRQIGPFAATGGVAAESVFQKALRSVSASDRIFLDVPASNRSAARLLKRRGFQIAGSTELMYAGARPDYHPELIYALATMGSCG